MNGPLPADELARIQAYYGGTPGQNMSPANAPPPPVAAPPAPMSEADYYGPPPAAAGPPPVQPIAPTSADPFAVGLGQPAPPPVLPANMPVQEVTGAPPNGPPPPPAGPVAPVSVPVVHRDVKPANAPAATSGGGAPANRDPYGIHAAERGMMGAYEQQRSGIEKQANAEGARDLRRAEATEDLARVQTEDASIEHAERQQADQTFAEHMNEVQNQIDDLRAKKIDPAKKLRDSGLGILGIVAGVMGGLYQGATKSATNPFLDELHSYMDRELNTQRLDLDNQRASLGEQMSLLGQMRGIYKDSQLADSQTRNLIYEATKQQIEAEAAKANDPIEKARAEQAVAAVNMQQAQLQKQIGEQARAQATAAASQQFAQVKAARERLDKIYTETYDKALQATGNPAKAEYEAKRMVATLMGSGAPPRTASEQTAGFDVLANVPKPQQDHAAKELEAKATADKGVAAIRKAFEKYEALPATAGPWDREREAIRAAIMGAYKQALGPGMSSDKDAETFLEPLMPQTGSSAEVNAKKMALIQDQVESKIATPILDTYNPGWRGVAADVPKYDLQGKPK